MFTKFEWVYLFLFAICFCTKCVFTQDTPELASKDGMDKPLDNTDPVDSLNINKKSDNKPAGVDDKAENIGITSSKETPRLVLEGGGVVNLTSTVKPNKGLTEIGMSDDGTTHSKGSKPRKGVQGSSVVPRKGVDPFNLNQSSTGVTSDPSKESTNGIIGGNQTPANKTEPLKPDSHNTDETHATKITHPKKPAIVTDIEDVDDFDKYPIIQTSTTGEDYIIIGIVIVLGIWCSIFGALIFYRRAGEYWDRRHYRRMDFLVEGMYND